MHCRTEIGIHHNYPEHHLPICIAYLISTLIAKRTFLHNPDGHNACIDDRLRGPDREEYQVALDAIGALSSAVQVAS